MLLLPTAAVVCWKSNMLGKSALSLCLFFLIASNVQIILGRFTWRQSHVIGLHIAILTSIVISMIGLFKAKRSNAVFAGDHVEEKPKANLPDSEFIPMNDTGPRHVQPRARIRLFARFCL